MPTKKKLKRSVPATVSRRSSTRTENTSTFFNSKTFLIFVAIAVIVVMMAIFSSMNNTTSNPVTNGEQYHIDTSSLKNDASAQNVVP